MLNKYILKQLGIFTFLAMTGVLSACSDINTLSANHSASQLPRYNKKVMVAGGDDIIQHWTSQAVAGYCQLHHWPKEVTKVVHKPAANNPAFNQPRKTSVAVASNGNLHIHFQLGGVLMDNYSHELIIHQPSVKQCQPSTVNYEVTMQPSGNAVVYLSRPSAVIASPLNN